MLMESDQELDLAGFDYDNPQVGIDLIREANPHRHEFEMLTGIVHIDPDKQLIIGFKNMSPNDFWVRGHMPGVPLFPGVLMCEAAAQLCGYYYVSQKIGDAGNLLGLGGIDETRFHRTVKPGERLVLVGTGVKVHRRMTKFRVLGYVDGEKTFETLVTGVPLGKMRELRSA
jgi:3-hydroxyacyl-[acyl-carrier-protein] dehydratase